MYPLNHLLGSGYNNTQVFFIRCTIHISGLFMVNEIHVEDVDLQIHIVQSNFIGLRVLLKILPRETSAVRPVAHLTVHDSIIKDTNIKMVTTDSTTVGIVQITNTILIQTLVKCTDYVVSVSENGHRSVQAAFFIDNCTFIQSSLHSPKSIIVYILNSRFECQTKRCALTLAGPNDVDMDISHINAMCDLFQIKMCYGIKLSNTDFISTESETQLLTIEGNQTILENCTFSISTFVPIYVTQNLIFEDRSKIIHLINVKINVTEIKSLDDIPLFSINTSELSSQSVLLFCPKSFKVIEKISGKDNNLQFPLSKRCLSK